MGGDKRYGGNCVGMHFQTMVSVRGDERAFVAWTRPSVRLEMVSGDTNRLVGVIAVGCVVGLVCCLINVSCCRVLHHHYAWQIRRHFLSLKSRIVAGEHPYERPAEMQDNVKIGADSGFSE